MPQSSGFLRHRLADHAVRLDVMNSHAARAVVRDEQIIAGAIDAVVDRPMRQRDRLAMRCERARRIDPERRHVMAVAARAWAAGTRRHVQEFPVRMRPRILRAVGKLHRPAFGERRAFHVNIVLGEFGPHARIECHFLFSLCPKVG